MGRPCTNGVIVERGANASGQWVKFSDSTMIQWGQIGVIATGGVHTFNFPVPFNSLVSISGNTTPNASWQPFYVYNSNNTAFSILAGVSGNSYTWMAIGTWREI